MYNTDQWKIMKQLAGSLPKRESLKIGDIKDKCFKSAPNDRVVRNAIRKPVAEGHVEIADRGDYRLTAKGAAFCQKMEKEGFKPASVRQMAKPSQSIKKSAKKAAPKKVAKTNGAKVESKPTEKSQAPEPKKSSVKIPRPKKDESAAAVPPSTLSF